MAAQHMHCRLSHYAGLQVGQRAVITRATFGVPLKAGSSAVITLPWMYTLPFGMEQDPDSVPQGAEAANAGRVATVPLTDLVSAHVVVRTLAYPA